MFDNTIILKGEENYLGTLKPLLDPVYTKFRKPTSKRTSFLCFVDQLIARKRKLPIVKVFKAYIKKAQRNGLTRGKIYDELKPFQNFEVLSEYLPFVVVYRDFKSSIIYAEHVSQ